MSRHTSPPGKVYLSRLRKGPASFVLASFLPLSRQDPNPRPRLFIYNDQQYKHGSNPFFTHFKYVKTPTIPAVNDRIRLRTDVHTVMHSSLVMRGKSAYDILGPVLAKGAVGYVVHLERVDFFGFPRLWSRGEDRREPFASYITGPKREVSQFILKNFKIIHFSKLLFNAISVSYYQPYY